MEKNWTVTHTWGDTLTAFNDKGEVVEVSLNRVIPELYTGAGVYIKRGSAFKVGTENDINWWSLNPFLGRFEYVVESVEDNKKRVHLTPNINFTIIEGEKGYKYGEYWVPDIPSTMVMFYLDNKHTLDDSDIVFFVGKRQMKSKLVRL